jgi:hypothetical protein
VLVEAYTPLPGSPAPALHIVITPSTENTPGITGLPPESNSNPSPIPKNRPAARNTSAHHPGFTHEEELFRTKWGWAAYDAVRRAALTSDNSSE